MAHERIAIDGDPCQWELALHFAHSQVGVTEATNRNDGVEVEQYLRSVGLRQGNPYCAAGVYWCHEQAAKENGSKNPVYKSGSTFYQYEHAKQVGTITDGSTPRRADLVYWKYSNSISGHVGFIDSVGTAGWIRTVEFNTTVPGSGGTERDGGGVAIKIRSTVDPLGRMLCRGFVGGIYANE